MEILTLASSPSLPTCSTWAIDDTADTRARCEGLLAEAVSKSATDADVTNVFPAGVIYRQKNGIVGARNYKCLPDTIDPRGEGGGE